MPFHFCHEELLAIMMAIPIVKHSVTRVRVWFHKRRECKCDNKPEEDSDG